MDAPTRSGAPICAQYTIRRGPGEGSLAGKFAGNPAEKVSGAGGGSFIRDHLSVDRGGPPPYTYYSPFGARTVSVAQLAEHQTVALAVAGSIPVTHPIIFRRL